MLNAHILSIGTEILMGELVDTNAPYIASKLPDIGINVISISQVDDKYESIISALTLAIETCDIVFTTGGLGPTGDDVTRESISQLLGEVQYLDDDLLDTLSKRYETYQSDIPSESLKQATLIPSAVAIRNPQGTAPGWWVQKQDKLIIAMPGPPSELESMWASEVEPRLTHLTDDIWITRSLKTFGAGETILNEKIGHLFNLPTVGLGMYAQNPGVDIRIRAKSKDTASALKIISPVESEIRDLLSHFIWGIDGETIEGVVGNHMAKLKMTLATMESCTGGLLAYKITQVPGSSRYFRGGVVSYSNQTKIDAGVNSDTISRYGSVSEEVAKEMAETIRLNMQANVGIAITGVAGPDTIEGKDVGTVHTGISINGTVAAYTSHYNGSRESIRRLATMESLLNLTRLLADKYSI